MRRLRVLATQEEIVPELLAGATAVVIDVMLATTTLVTILENGARRVLPVGSLQEAEQVCARLDAAALVRGGEQDALAIDGFDCGPFPDEYPPSSVRGKDVVFVSTNGTRAIAKSVVASQLLVASLRNAPAVGRYLRISGADSVSIVCAGSKGRFSLEDFACAGVLLQAIGTDGWHLNDAAWLARDVAERYQHREAELLRNARAGKWFLEHGRTETFDFAATLGASDVVAEVRDGALVRVGAAEQGAR
jgi:2-phosphosulfolactate phosphatase